MPKNSPEYTEEDLKLVADFCHILAGKRYEILDYLNGMRSPVSWPNMMFDLEMNPKTQRHHLGILRSNGFVEDVKGYGYILTIRGKKAFGLVDKCFRRVVSNLEKAGCDFSYRKDDCTND